jgi:hypothetical protein
MRARAEAVFLYQALPKRSSAVDCPRGNALVKRKGVRGLHEVSGGEAGQRYAGRNPSRIMTPAPQFGQRRGGRLASA